MCTIIFESTHWTSEREKMSEQGERKKNTNDCAEFQRFINIYAPCMQTIKLLIDVFVRA